MRKALSVSALILALTCFAHAGIMQNDSPQPPPPQSATAVQTTTDGDIQNDVAQSLTQIALDVLAVLPSLP